MGLRSRGIFRFKDAVDTIKKLDIIAQFDDSSIRAAIIMLYCTFNKDWSLDRIVKISGYDEEEVGSIIVYLIDSGYLSLPIMKKDGILYLTEWRLNLNYQKSDEEILKEFIAVAIKAAGEIQQLRINVKE